MLVFKPQITVHIVEQVGKSVPLDIFKACGQLEAGDKTYGLKRVRFYCFKPLLYIHGFQAAVSIEPLRLDGAVARRNKQFFHGSMVKAVFCDFSYRLAFVRFGQRQLARQRIRLFCRYGVSLAVLCFLKDKIALVGGSVNVLGSHRQIFRYSFQSRRGQIPADKFVCKVSVGRVGGRYGVAQIRHLFDFKRLAFVVKKLDGQDSVLPSSDKSDCAAVGNVYVAVEVKPAAVRPSLELVAHSIGRSLDGERSVMIDALLHGRLQPLAPCVVLHFVSQRRKPRVQRFVGGYFFFKIKRSCRLLAFVPTDKPHSLRAFRVCRVYSPLLVRLRYRHRFRSALEHHAVSPLPA